LCCGCLALCKDYTFDGNDDNKFCRPKVLEVAKKNPDLSIVIMLIEAAGLEDIFDCSGPFTLLLPTNEAFEKVDGLVPKLLLRENLDVLKELLLYHTLAGSFPSSNLVAGPLETLAGITVQVSKNPIMFNDDVGVILPDQTACNGLFYVLDGILTPNKSK
jgi:uncharacterized surface protein with fasciclin (FAS1) repeats